MHQGERQVLRALRKHMKASGSVEDVTAGSHMLAKQLGMEQPKVYTIFKKLVRCGVLVKTYDGKRGSGKDCSARFTLNVDGLKTPYTDPMARRYERVAFNGNHINSSATASQEGHSEDTQSMQSERQALDTNSDDTPLAEQVSWQADDVGDRFGADLLGFTRERSRTRSQDYASRVRVFNRLRLYGKPIPPGYEDVQAAYDAKRASRLTAREAVESESIEPVSVAQPAPTRPRLVVPDGRHAHGGKLCGDDQCWLRIEELESQSSDVATSSATSLGGWLQGGRQFAGTPYGAAGAGYLAAVVAPDRFNRNGVLWAGREE